MKVKADLGGGAAKVKVRRSFKHPLRLDELQKGEEREDEMDEGRGTALQSSSRWT